MEISIPKTKVMHIHKKDRVSKTTDAEISDMGFKNICDRCSRDFPTKRGLSIHRGRWCDGGKTKRSRLGSLADKAVKQKKRKAKETQRQHVQLDGISLENVHNFVYLGSCFQSDGDDTADVNHRMNVPQSSFSDLHQLWWDTRLPI